MPAGPFVPPLTRRIEKYRSWQRVEGEAADDQQVGDPDRLFGCFADAQLCSLAYDFTCSDRYLRVEVVCLRQLMFADSCQSLVSGGSLGRW